MSSRFPFSYAFLVLAFFTDLASLTPEQVSAHLGALLDRLTTKLAHEREGLLLGHGAGGMVSPTMMDLSLYHVPLPPEQPVLTSCPSETNSKRLGPEGLRAVIAKVHGRAGVPNKYYPDALETHAAPPLPVPQPRRGCRTPTDELNYKAERMWNKPSGHHKDLMRCTGGPLKTSSRRVQWTDPNIRTVDYYVPTL